MNVDSDHRARVVNVCKDSPLELRVYDDLDRIPGQQAAWNELVDKSAYPNVFLRWEWITRWWNWFGQNQQLHVLVVSRGPMILGIVPLYAAANRSRRLLARRLRFLGAGGPTCPEYLGPIVHKDFIRPVIQEIARYLRASPDAWELLEFADTAPDDVATHELITELCGCYSSLARTGNPCPYLTLPETYDALLKRLSSHSRQRKKRQLRRAEEECAATMDVASTSDALSAAFPTIVELSKASRGRSGERSPFLDAQYAGFHSDVMTALSASGITRVYLLNFHGKTVAFLYGFVFHGKYYAFQTGFDTDLIRFSPGDVVYQMTFRHLINEGIEEFDYLRGDESYKKFFASDTRFTRQTTVYRQRGLNYLSHKVRAGMDARIRGMKRRFCSATESS